MDENERREAATHQFMDYNNDEREDGSSNDGIEGRNDNAERWKPRKKRHFQAACWVMWRYNLLWVLLVFTIIFESGNSIYSDIVEWLKSGLRRDTHITENKTHMFTTHILSCYSIPRWNGFSWQFSCSLLRNAIIWVEWHSFKFKAMSLTSELTAPKKKGERKEHYWLLPKTMGTRSYFERFNEFVQLVHAIYLQFEGIFQFF